MAHGTHTRVLARLIAQSPAEPLTIELRPGLNRVGRQRTDNDIVIATPLISRCHAEILVDEQGIVLRDLGSANGTFVNGQRVDSCRLSDGDRIRFAETMVLELKLFEPSEGRLPASPVDAPPPPPPPLASQGGGAVGGVAVEALMDTLDEEPPDEETTIIQRERQQLTKLYRFSKRCLQVASLAQLDELILSELRDAANFDRGFVAYQLVNGDWKLVLAPQDHICPPQLVRGVLQRATASDAPIIIADSSRDVRLGVHADGIVDFRLALPLRGRDRTIGAIFLVNHQAPFAAATVDYLELFADIAALGISNAIQLGRI